MTASKAKLNRKDAARMCEEAGITPLEFLLKVIKNPQVDLRLKVDAAKGALPFVHQRLTSIDLTTTETVSQEEALLDLD